MEKTWKLGLSSGYVKVVGIHTETPTWTLEYWNPHCAPQKKEGKFGEHPPTIRFLVCAREGCPYGSFSKRGDPQFRPSKYSSPYDGDPQNGIPNFGKAPYSGVKGEAGFR